VEAESSLTAQHWEARALAMERLVQERARRAFSKAKFSGGSQKGKERAEGSQDGIDEE
jgi:hypothetical protein